MSEKRAKELIEIKKTAIGFRDKQKKNKKKEITDNELHNWYETVQEITYDLMSKRADGTTKEWLALTKFVNLMPDHLPYKISKIRKYLNMLLNNFDIFYPKLFKRYFHIKFSDANFIMTSESIVQQTL